MPFLRRSYKQKPQAWGPVSQVQASIFKNAEMAGYDPASIIWSNPLWGPGNPIDYSKNKIVTTSYADYSGGAYKSGSGKYLSVPDNANVEFSGDYCLFLTFSLDAEGASVPAWNGIVSKHFDFTFYYYQSKFYVYNISGDIPATPFGKIVTVCFKRVSDNNTVYIDGKIVKTFSKAISSNANDLILGYNSWSTPTGDYSRCSYYNVWKTTENLTDSAIAYASDNPYFLLAKTSPVFYVDMGAGGVTYEVSCADGFSWADASSKIAIFQAAAAEAINLADSDQNIAQFIAAMADSFTVSDITSKTVTLRSTATDSFSISDVTTSLQTIIALVSDSATFADLSVVRADFSGAVSESVQFSETLLATLHAQAVVSEIVNLSAVTDAEILSNLIAYVTDSFNVSASPAARVGLLAALTDVFNLSDSALSILQAYASAADSLTVSGVTFWANVVQGLINDSFTVSGSVTSLIKMLVQAAETVTFNDTGSVTASYNVQVQDSVQFAQVIACIAQFRAAISDGFNLTATAMEVSQLPNGKVSISFSIKTPGVGFDIKTATIVFNIK